MQEPLKVKYLGRIAQRSMNRKGLLNWPEGGWLDRLDKGLSNPIFRLEFDLKMEIFLSCPSLWFGVLIYAVNIIPVTLVASAPGTSWRFATLACGPWIGLMLRYWPQHCISSSVGGSSVGKKLVEFKPGMLLAGPYICLASAHFASSPAAWDALSLFFSSFYATNVLTDLLKGLVWRRRPLAGGIGKELKRFDRALPDATLVLHTDVLINLSFPCVFAANAAVWATTLSLTAPWYFGLPVASLVVLLSGFGNVYFRLHHVLDVLAGVALGLAVTLLMSRSGRASWAAVGLLQLCQALALGLVQRFLWPQVPPNPRQQAVLGLQLVKEKLS